MKRKYQENGGVYIKKGLHTSDSSTDIIGDIRVIWEMIQAGRIAHMGRKSVHIKILTGKQKAKTRLGRSRCRWKESYIKKGLHTSDSSTDIIGDIRVIWKLIQAGRMGRKSVHIKILIGKPKAKTRLGRSRFRWKDIIKMDFDMS
jgi:hypothetical protein